MHLGWGKHVCLALGVAAFGCVRAGFGVNEAPPGDATIADSSTDSRAPDARGPLDGPAPDTSCVLGPFSQPVNLPGVNSGSVEYSPTISGDGLTLVFGSPDRPGAVGDGDLWIATRASVGDDFNTPAPLGSPINTVTWEGDGELSLDGNTLYFDRRPSNNMDILEATWTGTGFDSVVPVAGVNTTSLEQGCTISSDGLELYFGSDRVGGPGATDIWVARRASTNAPFATPQLVVGVNSSSHDGFPSISGDKQTLYFETLRNGRAEIWSAQRGAGDSFTGAAPVAGVGSPFNDGDPDISADGRTLYFTSDRAGGKGDYDIWIAVRTCN